MYGRVNINEPRKHGFRIYINNPGNLTMPDRTNSDKIEIVVIARAELEVGLHLPRLQTSETHKNRGNSVQCPAVGTRYTLGNSCHPTIPT